MCAGLVVDECKNLGKLLKGKEDMSIFQMMLISTDVWMKGFLPLECKGIASVR